MRDQSEIRAIIEEVLRHGYASAAEKFSISRQSISKIMKSLNRYYQVRDYSSMSEEQLEQWFQIYFQRLVKTDVDLLEPDRKQQIWILELKAIQEESERRQTYHRHAIERFFEAQLKKHSWKHKQ